MSTAAALRAVHATEGGWFHVSAFAALLRCTEAEALTALDLGVAAGYLQKFVPIPGKTPPIYRETTRGDWVLDKVFFARSSYAPSRSLH